MVIVVSYAVFGFYSKHGKPRERERLRERKREREREKEREREREGETYTEQPETIRVQREHSTLNNAATMHACKTCKQ